MNDAPPIAQPRPAPAPAVAEPPLAQGRTLPDTWQMVGPGDLDVPLPVWPDDAPVPYRVRETGR